MKKILSLVLPFAMAFSLAACSVNTSNAATSESPVVPQTDNTTEATTTAEPTEAAESESLPVSTANTLVVYFSMPETTDPNNMTEEEDNSVVVIDGEVLGNTQYVAHVIQQNTGADMFRIEPETPYPVDHDTLVDLAAEEQNSSARPAIRDHIENLEQYDTIFVGYPNWWGDMPMILYSFFEEYDFAGKTIIPFNTHGGSGFSSTIEEITRLEPEATVNQDGFTVSRNNVQEAEPDILAWLNQLSLSVSTDTAQAGVSAESAQAEQTQINITIGDQVFNAVLDDSDIAREFAELLPQTISMQRVGGGREFYGSIDGSLNYDMADSQTTFENGDIAYWYSGNGFCILYDNQVAEPEVGSGIVMLGNITSDISLFHEMDDRMQATVTLAK